MRCKNLLIHLMVVSIFIIGGCSGVSKSTEKRPNMSIIPKPQSIEYREGYFTHRGLFYDVAEELQSAAFFTEILDNLLCSPASGKQQANLSLNVDMDLDLPAEGYVLNINKTGIEIWAGDEPGLFYGLQTLRQILPAQLEQKIALENPQRLPLATITDYPRFGWRGMHLDVSRHFFPVDFVKQYIDMIALHKMNVFHWHLTDDNGWRLEIKKYPKLTEICAWRVDREHEDWRKWSPVKPGEKSTYGGFYTQDEVRDVIAYAAERQITIIPEIEMPGHSSELFAAFPELSCRGEVLPVRPGAYWPNKDILCAGNDDVFTFLEDVIDEVAELFPAEYIHVGGDEATKTYWETCPKCQARIAEEGLGGEHELQSWFIQKMEKYIISKGKRLIGWDEILEGGLAPEATVMSWRGEAGGIKAAKAGHDVIMTPYSHVYFDYYQGDPKTEPQAIGGYLPLKTVYSFEPIPDELTEDEAAFILGAQANLWTEFVKTPRHAQYMVLPRMSALAEVVWSAPESRDFNDFHARLEHLRTRFDYLEWNHSQGSFIVEILPGGLGQDDHIEVNLLSEQPDLDLRYTLDGKDPDAESSIYTGPLSLHKDAVVKAGLFKDHKVMGQIVSREFAFHQAINAETVYKIPYSKWYKAGGDDGLVDGILGTENHKDGTWQGFHGDDLELTIDLKEVRTIFKAEMNFLQSAKSWIFMPEYLEVSLSMDGETWETVQRIDNEVPEETAGPSIHRLTAGFPSTETRFVRVLAKNRGTCPDWHQGAGETSWIFSDEVIVR